MLRPATREGWHREVECDDWLCRSSTFRKYREVTCKVWPRSGSAPLEYLGVPWLDRVSSESFVEFRDRELERLVRFFFKGSVWVKGEGEARVALALLSHF